MSGDPGAGGVGVAPRSWPAEPAGTCRRVGGRSAGEAAPIPGGCGAGLEAGGPRLGGRGRGVVVRAAGSNADRRRRPGASAGVCSPGFRPGAGLGGTRGVRPGPRPSRRRLHGSGPQADHQFAGGG